MTAHKDEFTWKHMFDSIVEALPKETLDGMSCILEMRDHPAPDMNNNYRQMEWIGFYIEHYLAWHLTGQVMMNIGKDKIGYTSGHGNKKVYIDCRDREGEMFTDIKTHANISGQTKKTSILLNDAEATKAIIREHSAIGIIVIEGYGTLDDEDRTFQAWHEMIKGGESAYTKKNKAMGKNSRKRKTSFVPTSISLYVFTEKDINTKAFKEVTQGKNSNGKPRPKKFKMDTRYAKPMFTYTLV